MIAVVIDEGRWCMWWRQVARAQGSAVHMRGGGSVPSQVERNAGLACRSSSGSFQRLLPEAPSRAVLAVQLMKKS